MEKNYSVDETMMESALDDAAQAPDARADALSEALGIAEPEDTAAAGQDADGDALEEPKDKGLRGRMKQYEQRGYNRALKEHKEAESKWAERERGYQERLARYEQLELETDAKKFAQENNIPENFALEYMRMKKGLPAVAEQPRDDAGRYAPQNNAAEAEGDAAVKTRAAALMTQAEAFEKMSDGAVTRDAILEAFQNDPDIRQRVASGEWDFTDVGRSLRDGKSRAPHVARSASNGRINTSVFMGMSDEEFAKFDSRISAGEIFDARR